MTLLKRLKEGKDEIEEHIRSHLPPHGSLPDAPVLRDTDFYKKFVALAADWEVQQLQLKRGLLGPPLADEPEVIETVFGNVNGESDLNTALSVYAERKEHRKTLGPRIVRQLKARNKQLMKLAGIFIPRRRKLSVSATSMLTAPMFPSFALSSAQQAFRIGRPEATALSN
jgi:hypothetical protein